MICETSVYVGMFLGSMPHAMRLRGASSPESHAHATQSFFALVMNDA